MLVFVTALFCTVGARLTAELLPKVVNSFETTNPGFIEIGKNSSVPTWDILVSRFNGFPFSSDYVSVVRDIGNRSSQSSSQVEDLSSKLHWPNEPGFVPENVFSKPNMVIIPSGFLVPTKGKGALTLFDLDGAVLRQPFQVTSDEDGDWFYHRAIWLDMDGDGRVDIVTCRAQKPIFGKEKGEMLWFKHPDVEKPWTEVWQRTVLVEGAHAPDTFLIPVQMMTGDGKLVQTLLTAGFFSQSLSVWWRKQESMPWTQDNLNKRVLDITEGAVFDLLFTDLNNDGRAELLVTYNKPVNGTVFVYELLGQGDLRTDKFVKRMILSGIDPAKSGIGKGAPGGIKVIRPDLRNKTARPDIILSGDDNGKLYMLRAQSTRGWDYRSVVLIDASPGTMGAMDVAYINGDYYATIIAPSYSNNRIYILSYDPATRSAAPRPQSTSYLHRLISWIKSFSD